MKKLLPLLFANFLVCSLAAQSGFSLQFGLSGHLGDANYGTAYLSDYLPRDDYQFFSASGEGDPGFGAMAEAQFFFARKWMVGAHLGYTRMYYDISGFVRTIRPSVMRDLDPTIPVSTSGDIHYNFVNTGLRTGFHFRGWENSGWYIKIGADAMHLLAATWEVASRHEDGLFYENNDLDALPKPDFQTVFAIGFGGGYQYVWKNNFAFFAETWRCIGLNAFVENNLVPYRTDLVLGVRTGF